MPKGREKNPSAVIMGRLSGLSRGSQPNQKLIRLTKKQIQSATTAFAKMGSLKGASKGGNARAAKLDARTRKSIAIVAANARCKRKVDDEVNHN